ncbi:MAG: transposase [Thermoleophilia bacterium]
MLYHVIARGIERRQIFSDNADRDFFLARLGRLVRETGMHVYAFALIPNHFHLLVRRDAGPLASFMQRLLTAYAIYYNRKIGRTGHLFQNRYKTVICQDDVYFMQLVRYICLNPLRAGLMADLDQLSSFDYSAYAYILGRKKLGWFDPLPVLAFYGGKRASAVCAFKKFVTEGLEDGKKPELEGGGLKRSLGLPERLPREQQAYDERILGQGGFVETVIGTTAGREEMVDGISPEAIMEEVCELFQISLAELTSGSRTRVVCAARAHAARNMAVSCRISKSEIASRLSVSLPAILKQLRSNPSSPSKPTESFDASSVS